MVPLVTIGKEFYGLRLNGTTSLIEPSKDFRLQAGYELGRNVSVGLEWVPIPRSGASGSSVGSSLGNLSPIMLAHGRGCYLMYETRERVRPAPGTYALRRCFGRATFLRRSRFSS